MFYMDYCLLVGRNGRHALIMGNVKAVSMLAIGCHGYDGNGLEAQGCVVE